MNNILNYIDSLGIKKDFYFIPTLSRGLSYYTGPMWEVYLQKSKIKSSVAAGGRWDKMIQNFLQSEREYPATGMTFGLDVIYTAITEDKIKLNAFERTPKVVIIPLDKLEVCLKLASELRKNKISSSIAYDDKLSKALDYANKESIPYVIVIGKKEIDTKIYGLKNMITGDTKNLKLNEIISYLNA